MATVIVYDPNDAYVSNRVITYLTSAHSPYYSGDPNTLINHDVSSLSAVPWKYWKYDGVSDIIEMSSAEKDILNEYLTKPDVTNVKILEEDIALTKRTGGNFKATTIEVDVPGSVGIYTHDFSFPYDISMLSIEYVGQSVNKDDVFSVCVGPDTVIGSITSDVAISDVVIDVSATVITNAFIGMKCNITNLSETDDLGYIIGVDDVNNQITVTTAATQVFSAASPTYVRVAVEPVKDIIIDETSSAIQVGGSKIGGSFVAADTVFRVYYDNKDGVAKKFRAIMELLY